MGSSLSDCCCCFCCCCWRSLDNHRYDWHLYFEMPNQQQDMAIRKLQSPYFFLTDAPCSIRLFRTISFRTDFVWFMITGLQNVRLPFVAVCCPGYQAIIRSNWRLASSLANVKVRFLLLLLLLLFLFILLCTCVVRIVVRRGCRRTAKLSNKCNNF